MTKNKYTKTKNCVDCQKRFIAIGRMQRCSICQPIFRLKVKRKSRHELYLKNGLEYQRKCREENRHGIRDREKKSYRKYHVTYYQKVRLTPEFKFKAKARKMVLRAISNGILKRLPCEICGELKSHAHHVNYQEALKVRWLCKFHHSEVHKKFNPLVLK